jgi:ribonuclease P protein component
VSERFAFPKERRLRTRREFVAAQSSGVRVHTPHFVLVLAKGPDANAPARLGVTVTRKIGGAVQRNRCKRLVREAFRLDRDLLPNGLDFLVIAKDGAPGLRLADVQAEWARVRATLQRRARELCAPPAAPAPSREES